MKTRTNKHDFIATIAIITLALVLATLSLTACGDDNGNTDPVCTCPAGTTHADGVTCCNENDCTCGIDPKTVNIAPEGASIKIYNHTSTPNANMLSLAEDVSTVHYSIIEGCTGEYAQYMPEEFMRYASYGNNIIVIFSDTAKKSQLNGQTLTIYIEMAAYVQGGSDANALQALMLAGADPANIQ